MTHSFISQSGDMYDLEGDPGSPMAISVRCNGVEMDDDYDGASICLPDVMAELLSLARMNDKHEEARELLIWIAEHLEAEPMSGMMPGGPFWNVQVTTLLDKIGCIWKLSAEEIGEVVNPIREKIEAAG